MRRGANCSRNWLAFGPFLNQLRVREYGMRPLSLAWSGGVFLQAKIPHMCLWSSHILPRPLEWDQSVSILGYTSLDRETQYTPPDSLQAFLASGKPVIAISFGSMTIPDPTKLLFILSSALGKVQATAVVCRSWSAKLESHIGLHPLLYLADPIPHGWLLPRVDGFVHHGGAGHTAAGLRAGVPMLLVPFFLDQYFWAAKIRDLELGPLPLEIRTLKAPDLAVRLKDLLSGRYRDRCAKTALRVRAEGDGAEAAAAAIAGQIALPVMNTPCALMPALRAYWRHAESGLPLSGAAAACLVLRGVLGWDDVELLPRLDWAERWRDVSPSRGGFHVLFMVTDMLRFLLGVFLAMQAWFLGLRNDGVGLAKERDPVRQARIRQGGFDLHLIRRHIDAEKPPMMEDQLARYWQNMTTAKFHERFRDGRHDL